MITTSTRWQCRGGPRRRLGLSPPSHTQTAGECFVGHRLLLACQCQQRPSSNAIAAAGMPTQRPACPSTCFLAPTLPPAAFRPRCTAPQEHHPECGVQPAGPAAARHHQPAGGCKRRHRLLTLPRWVAACLGEQAGGRTQLPLPAAPSNASLLVSPHRPPPPSASPCLLPLASPLQATLTSWC